MKKATTAIALVLAIGLFAAAFSLAPAIAQYTQPPSTSTKGYGNASSNAASSSNQTSGNATSTAGENATSSQTFSAMGSIATLIFDTGPTVTTTAAQNQTSPANDTSTAGTNVTRSNQTVVGDNTTAPLPRSFSQGNTSSNATVGNNASNNTATTTSNMTSTPSATSNETSTAAQLEQPYIASGDWNLDVKDGKVTDFKANLTMVHVDGTGRHTHQLSNFVSTSVSQNAPTTKISSVGNASDNANATSTSSLGTSSVKANSSATSSSNQTSANATGIAATNSSAANTSTIGTTTYIFGTVDVAKDGQPMWKGVKALIIIDKNNVISFSVATEDTDNHFKGQPIYGVVNSMKDANGNELVTSTGTQTASNLTSGAMGENTTVGNQGIQNLTKGSK